MPEGCIQQKWRSFFEYKRSKIRPKVAKKSADNYPEKVVQISHTLLWTVRNITIFYKMKSNFSIIFCLLILQISFDKKNKQEYDGQV